MSEYFLITRYGPSYTLRVSGTHRHALLPATATLHHLPGIDLPIFWYLNLLTAFGGETEMFSGHFMCMLHLLPELVNIFSIVCYIYTITCVLTAEHKLCRKTHSLPMVSRLGESLVDSFGVAL